MLDYEGTSHMKKMLKDFLCGSFAGVFLTVSGHPFDFIKVRMQTASPPVGLTKCISQIIKSKGPFSFYKGLTPPLSSIPLVNDVHVFLWIMKKIFRSWEWRWVHLFSIVAF